MITDFDGKYENNTILLSWKLDAAPKTLKLHIFPMSDMEFTREFELDCEQTTFSLEWVDPGVAYECDLIATDEFDTAFTTLVQMML